MYCEQKKFIVFKNLNINFVLNMTISVFLSRHIIIMNNI